eukprot:GFUD01030319.1.p1 GENE.GFUD01030319.1~~GFUD01030319.1.p1  ORF type:complete len:235 (+),score=52.50 GFUD01030319.1:102-806(+)
MPVKTDKLLQLLCLMFLTYWLLRSLLVSVAVSEEMEEENENKLFTSKIVDVNTVKYVSQLTYVEFLQGLKNDPHILKDFINILKNSDFPAYFFETPKVTQKTLTSTTFEFVLAKADSLDSVQAEESTFEEYFGTCNDRLVTNFANLGGDAMLVVPCPAPEMDKQSYASIAPFVRSAQTEQIEQFWKLSAQVMLDHVRDKGKNPTWMSTSGLGVYWLHLRLDSRPKYYTYNPYRH